MKQILIDYFYKNISIKSDCWCWNKGTKATIDGYAKSPWVLSWEIHHGIAPTRNSKLIIYRTCCNKKCVNPGHLTVGTAKQMRDNRTSIVGHDNIKGRSRAKSFLI